MKHYFSISVCYIFFFVINVHSQVGGTQVYQFLNVSTSARQLALGGEVITLLDDVSQPIWNPATINDKLDKKLSVNYSSYLAGINIGSVSYAQKINDKFGTLQASAKYVNYGSLIGADLNGNETGTFGASDIALSVGYSRNIDQTNFYIGANIKLINSSIANFSSFGIAADIGFLYYNPEKPYVLALAFRNIGTQIQSFNGTREKLPFRLSIGGSYKMEHVPLRWYATIDNLQKWTIAVPNPSNQTTDLYGNVVQKQVSFTDNLLRHITIGAELFPRRAINLRIGYNFRRSKELELQNVRTFGGLCFGFGLKMNRFRLNYAYSKVHSASNISTFSLQIDLGKSNE